MRYFILLSFFFLSVAALDMTFEPDDLSPTINSVVTCELTVASGDGTTQGQAGCDGGNCGYFVSVSVFNAANGDITYSAINNGTGMTVPHPNTSSGAFPGLCPGNYTFMAEDSEGCTDNFDYLITSDSLVLMAFDEANFTFGGIIPFFTSTAFYDWNLDNPISQWEGVCTFPDGCIQRLDLDFGADCSGDQTGTTTGWEDFNTIPDEVGNLSQIEALSLGSTNFIGGINPNIGNLTTLKALYITDTNLDEIPAWLDDLDNIDTLSLSGNQIEGGFPDFFCKFCDIGYTSFDGNPSISNAEFVTFCAANQADCFSCNPVSDSLALVALYNATDGANWTNTWDLSTPFSTWYGIQTDGDGCVTCIDLDGTVDCGANFSGGLAGGNNLIGTMPLELQDLEKLRHLSLSFNSFSGVEIPSFIGNFNNLTVLSLRNIGLIGNIPTALSSLSNLLILNLSENNLDGTIPLSIFELENLIGLYLSNNSIEGNFSFQAGQLPFLEDLMLNNNQLTGSISSTTGELSNLYRLHLYNNQLDGNIPSELGTLSNLNELRLYNNQLEGNIPPELGSLNNLTQLFLQNNQLDGCFPNEINTHCQLGFTTILFLNGYNITNNPALPWTGNMEMWCNGEEQTGAPCDDGNTITTNDVITAACGCEGTVPQSCDSVSDSLALIALYNATDGANWTNTWDLDTPYSTWYGIETDGNGCVTCIDLDGIPTCSITVSLSSGNNLTGNIPSELGNLTNLNILSLRENQLDGNIPSELGNLSNLSALFLTENQLDGNIPSELGNLSNLSQLYLSGNQLDGNIPSELGNLTNLNILSLTGNQLDGNIPPELGNFNNLSWFHLGNNQLDGNIPSELGNISNLSQLYLNDNQLDGNIPSELGNLNNLSQLYLNDNQLDGNIPSELGNLNNLNELNLFNNQLDGNIPSELGNLSNLNKLRLSINQLDGNIPSELGNLSNLNSLVLSSNLLEGCFPLETLPLCNLGINYNLSNNPALPWSGDMELWCNGEEQIGAPCNDSNPLSTNDIINTDCTCAGTISCATSDSLTLVDFYNNTGGENWTTPWILSSPVSTWFGVQTNAEGCVTCLDLDGTPNCTNSGSSLGNNLIGTIPTSLGDLSALTYLDLSINQLTGEIPEELGQLSNLEFLLLNDNDLVGEIPSTLENLSSLQTLGLYNNMMTGFIPTSFGNLSALTVLQLYNNNLDGSLPAELGMLSNLTEIVVFNNNLTGILPPEYGQLTALTLFSAYDNNLSGELPSEWGDLANLTELRLDSNNFSDCYPNSWNIFCGINTNFDNNPLLPDFTDFCTAGTGVCIDCNTAATDIGEAEAGIDEVLCEPLAAFPAVSGSLPNLATGVWLSLGEATLSNPSSSTSEVENLQMGNNEFVWSLSIEDCIDYDRDTVSLNYQALFATDAAMADTFFIAYNTEFSDNVITNDIFQEEFVWEAVVISPVTSGSLIFSPNGSFTYTPEVDFIGIAEFQYEVCNTLCPDECVSALVTIDINLQIADEFNPLTDEGAAPNVITPNGDLKNDFLIIPKLYYSPNDFPNNSLKIYNSWGSLIWSASPYNNDWGGVNKNGKELPQANYYFVFDDGMGEIVKGKVFILK